MSVSSALGGATFGRCVGRQRELAYLDELLDQALAGRGQFVLVSGEPGIGKTRLVTTFIGRAAGRGIDVVWGRCWDGGASPAFWPWIQVLRDYLRTQTEQLLSEIGAPAIPLAGLASDLARAAALPFGARDTELARFQLFDAVSNVVTQAATVHPLVIILEDLHAADLGSLLLLDFVARSVTSAPVLVVGTYRTAEFVDERVERALGQLSQTAQHLPLRGFGPDEVSAMVTAVTGVSVSAGVVEALRVATGGNPLYLDEVIRLLLAEGRLEDVAESGIARIPDGVRAAVRHRLVRLSTKALEVLTLAAVLGEEFAVVPLEHILGAEWVLDVLGEAARAGLVKEVRGEFGRFRFCHALIRQTLYEELSPSRRRDGHRVVAEALEELYATRRDFHVGELAHHFWHALPNVPPQKVIDYLQTAGHRALRDLAYEDAVLQHRRAAEVSRLPGEPVRDEVRCDVLLSLAEAAAVAGQQELVREAAQEARDLANALDDGARYGAAALHAGTAAARARDDAAAEIILREGMLRSGDADPLLRVRLLSEIASVVALRDASEADALSREALDLARTLGDRGWLSVTLQRRLRVLPHAAHAEERERLAREVVRLATVEGDARAACGALIELGLAALELGVLDEAAGAFKAARAREQELGQRELLGLTASTNAVWHLLGGRLEEAEQSARRALGDTVDLHDPFGRGLAARLLFLVHREQGLVDALSEDVARLVDVQGQTSVTRAARVLLAAETGKREEAERQLHTLAETGFAALPRDEGRPLALALLAEAALVVADRGAGESLAVAMRPLEHHAVCPTAPYTSIQRLLGGLAALREDWDEAERRFTSALDLAERLEGPAMRAKTECEYAGMLLRRGGTGDVEKASRLATAASENAQRLGMRAVAAASAALLERDVAPTREAPALPFGEGIFRKEDGSWLVALGNESGRVNDAKGMYHLAQLLANPDREIHVLDLVASVSPALARAGALTDIDLSAPGDAGPLLDAQAKASYKRRLADLREELDEAERFGDTERATRARAEQQFLVDELSRAVGLSGRDRRAASAAERARVNVTRTVKAALLAIERVAPSLAHHLRGSVSTGTFCCYAPDPTAPIMWRTR